jgi:hypothetical protein
MNNASSANSLNEHITLRISEKQKIMLIKKAKKHGFRTVSLYLRNFIDKATLIND